MSQQSYGPVTRARYTTTAPGPQGPPGPPGVGVTPQVVAGNTIGWGLTALLNGTSTSASLSTVGGAVGNHVLVAPPPDWPPGLLITGFVAGPNSVTIVVTNNSGSTQNIPVASTDNYTVRIYT